MLNFDDLRLKINPLYEGEELVNKLLILPEVDSKALSKGEKLFKLLELYKIFIPLVKIYIAFITKLLDKQKLWCLNIKRVINSW